MVFAIALKQEQYKTYVLSEQLSQSRLEVVPERGGIITSWQVRGQELLYLDAERFANPDQTVRGGIPILFPICGNLPDGTYTHNNQTYRLKQHGFARNLPWEVTDRITHDRVGITVVLNSNDETRAVYPFDFQLAFSYFLQGTTLEIVQRFTNRSSDPMPFSTGLHPYFLATDKSQLQFSIPGDRYVDQQTGNEQSFSGSFDFEKDEIDVAFRPVTRQNASVLDASRNLKLRLDYDSAYSTLVFWTVKGKEYYCLEPWSAPRNALNTGENLTYLESGQSLETLVRLTVSPFP
ncbi:MAG: aldose epimerase [Elainellaceae cyanobacterium]